MSVVLLDVEVLRKAPCGLAEVGRRLGCALLAQARPDIDLMFFVHPQHCCSLSGASFSLLRPRPWLKARRIKPFAPLLSRLAPVPRYSLWHSTNQHCQYLPLRADIPVILTVHDLNFMRAGKSPARVARDLERIQRRVDRATAITTASNFIAEEIAVHLDLKGKPVHVIHHGKPVASPTTEKDPGLPLTHPFLFSIGQFRSTKNFHLLIDLMHHVPEYQLVIAGNRESTYGKTVASRISDQQLGDRVFLPGEISNAERQWLYRHCAAFVFPSAAEGFGLPVLEAMDLGRPVFLNRATSLPEIGGNSAFYWDSFRPSHMAQTIRDGMALVARDPHYGEKLRRHARSFSWSEAARQYLDLYRQLLTDTNRDPRRRAA